jgi:glycosyltransferase involved in cell wall biosynthesis
MEVMRTSASFAILDPVGQKAGMELYDLGLARALSAQGASVHIFSNFEEQDPNLKIVRIFSDRPYRWWNLFRLVLAFRTALKKCRAAGVSTLIVHLFHFHRLDVWLLRKAKRMGFRTAGIVHDVEGFVRPTHAQHLLAVVQSGLDRIVVHNACTRDELSRLVGSRVAARIRVIPHGGFPLVERTETTKAAARARLGIGPDKYVVLSFGMIKPTKGLDTLIEAMKELPSDMQLLAAGRFRPGVPEDWRTSLRSLEEQGRAILHLSAVEAAAVSDYFQAADVVVLPYTRVYQSGVLVRAWSEGLPVILSDLPAFRESALEQEEALFFRVGDAAGLRQQLLLLKGDPSLSSKLQSGGRERLLHRHAWADIAREFSNLPE